MGRVALGGNPQGDPAHFPIFLTSREGTQPMSEQQALRQACLDDPEDRLLPLVYADWLEEHGYSDRAEYIRVKVAYERLQELDVCDDELLDRWGYHARLLRERLPQHLNDKVRSLDWRNGTHGHASANVADFLTLGEELFRAIPDLYSMSFESGCERAPELFRSPLLRRLRGLGFHAYRLAEGEQEQAIAALCDCRHLESLTELDLSLNRLTPRLLARLAGSRYLTSLRCLRCSSAWVDDAGAEALAEAPWLGRLRRFSLWGNRIGPDGVAALFRSHRFPLLHTLELADNPIGSKGVQTLASSPGLGSLLHLELRQTKLREAGVCPLAAAPWLSKVERLCLGNNPLGDRATCHLLGSPNLGPLQRLELGNAGIGDPAMLALAGSRRMARLVHLGLEGNEVTDIGAIALARSPYLGSLVKLNLNENRVGDAGFPALVASLDKLSDLWLHNNQVTDRGFLAIVDHPGFARLTSLFLGGNNVSESAGRTILTTPHLHPTARVSFVCGDEEVAGRITRALWATKLGLRKRRW
jgi:uncharacterized protein (TIGR02996 family)